MTLRTRHVSVMNMTLVGPVLPDIAASFVVSLDASGGTVGGWRPLLSVERMRISSEDLR